MCNSANSLRKTRGIIMPENNTEGCLAVIGIGPGSDQHITPIALDAIAASDTVIGYSTYIRLVKHLVKGKNVIRTGMTEEIHRARAAIEEARSGRKVCLVSSGDAGVYGMLSLVYQVLEEMNWKEGDSPTLQVLPGISAINSCASLIGAPLGHDYCCISLSDLLTPWPSIVRKIECAAEADFIIGFYNPASGRRQRQIVKAKEILMKFRSGATPVSIIKSAYRRQQEIVLSDLANFLGYEIGMNSTVIVGSTQTYVYNGKMITPRGYSNKYSWEGDIHEGQTKARSLNLEALTRKETEAND